MSKDLTAKAMDVDERSEMDADERAAFLAAVQEGIDDADAGRLIPFERVAAWVASWGQEDELPPPICE